MVIAMADLISLRNDIILKNKIVDVEIVTMTVITIIETLEEIEKREVMEVETEIFLTIRTLIMRKEETLKGSEDMIPKRLRKWRPTLKNK